MARKAPSKRAPAPEASKRKAKEPSQPDIRVAYTPAGRETLSAIEAELVPAPLPLLAGRDASSPEIVVREGTAGRETLAAILEEARSDVRPPQTTLRYGDRVSNAPGAKTPSTAPTATPAKAASTKAASAKAASGPEIFEMMTFVVRGIDAARLSSDALRRKFVEENLLGRLPTRSMADVDRIDVTPWTVQGTLVVRVWCRLAGAAG